MTSKGDEHRPEPDGVELDPETVEDLEPQENEAGKVRGGSVAACPQRGEEWTNQTK